MNQKELEKRLAKAAKSQDSCAAEIEEVERLYTELLCPKGKKICEPVYCTFQINNNCPFLDKWHFLVKKYKVSEY